MRKVWIATFCLSLYLLIPAAHAAPITLDAVATGSVHSDQHSGRGSDNYEYISTSPLTELRYMLDWGLISSGVSRVTGVGYVVFDLGDISDSMQSVSLEMDVAYTVAANPNLTIHALDTATALDLITNPAGEQRGKWQSSQLEPPSSIYTKLESQYDAIRAGAELGVLSQSGPFDGPFTVDLTSTTLGLVNATDGLFALGLTWSPNPDGFPGATDSIAFNSAPRLILQENVSPVPLPAAAWLFGTALIGLMGMARGQRV
jgi:hypothetical protein